MIKAFIRLSIISVIAVTTFFACGVLERSALALPQPEVLDKLRPIPVFIVVDDSGSPLVASVENSISITGVFISPRDANQFVKRVKDKNPELGAKVKVLPVRLNDVYQQSKLEQTRENSLEFAYIAQKEAVTSASKIISGASQEQLPNGVPLFMAKARKEDRYMIVTQNSQQLIPFFFDKQQLDRMIAKLEEQSPDLTDNFRVDVATLEGLIRVLETDQNEVLEKIVLVPTEESTKFIQSFSNLQ